MSTPDPATTEWVPLASGGPPGPQGPQGPQGPIGPARPELQSPSPEINDANNATATGWYEIQEAGSTLGYSGTPENMPKYGKWLLMVTRTENTDAGDTVRIGQIAFSPSLAWPNIYMRNYAYGSWGSWVIIGDTPDRLQDKLTNICINLNGTGATAWATNSGWAIVDPAAANKPPGLTTIGMLRVVAYSTGYLCQEVWELSTGRKWTRFCVNTVWGSWSQEDSPTVWTALSLGANIVANGAGYVAPAYRYSGQGMIELRGVVKTTAAIAMNGIIASVPVAAAPKTTHMFPASVQYDAGGNTVVCRLDVNTSGQIVLAGASVWPGVTTLALGYFLSLQGVRWSMLV